MAEVKAPLPLRRLAFLLGTPVLMIVGGWVVIATFVGMIFRMPVVATRFVITGEPFEFFPIRMLAPLGWFERALRDLDEGAQ